MSKHTPGPWYIPDEDELAIAERAQDPFDIYAEGDEYHERTICRVMTNHEGGVIAANARLIAAAPDMLALFIDMKREYDRESYYRNPEGVAYHSRMQAIYDVIAKATGGEDE